MKRMHVDRLVQGGGGEQICLAVRPHWFRIARQGMGALLLVLCGLALTLFQQQLLQSLAALTPYLVGPSDGTNPATPASAGLPGVHLTLEGPLTWGGIVTALAGALLLAWALLVRHFTEYAITMTTNFGGRIIKVQGVFSRQTVAVPLGMVNNLVVNEPLLGRILNWGHIDIETGNDYNGDRLEYIPDPQGFHQIWKTLLDNGYGTPARINNSAFEHGPVPGKMSSI